MRISPAGLDLIKSREGLKLKAYLCPAKVWTIGYGHTGPEVHEGWEISNEEADALLQSDVLSFDAGVSAVCNKSTQSQHDALVCLAFNIGLGAFRKSSVCRLHNAGKHPEAAQAFALWNKAGGKILAGLVSRRAAEAALYLADVPQEQAANADGEKPLVQSRAINGQVIAGGTTVITAAASALPDDTLSTIKEALGGIDATWVGYAVLALTLVGIGLSVYARWRDRQEGRA